MRSTALLGLLVCLLLAGAAGFAYADDPGHVEPENVAAACHATWATVSWNAVTDAHLSGYDVYKKVASDPGYTKANSALVTGTTYDVTGLASGTTYNFAVMAMYNDGHSSALSTPATCTTG